LTFINRITIILNLKEGKMAWRVFCFLLLLSLCQHCLAQEFYVDAKNGHDDHPGSANQPFKTIAKAVQTANELTGAGTITLKLMPTAFTR
jgi:hypothetical protein